MFGILIILFTVLPALEFYLLYQIGSSIGAFNTFTIIIVTGVAGAFLARTQGLSILHKIQSEVEKGAMPGKHIIHGFIVFGGGLLLLTPGFLTDILGFCMVIPGTRHIIVALASEYLKRGIANGSVNIMGGMSSTGGGFQFHHSSTTATEQEPFTTQIDGESDVFEAEFHEKDPESK